MTETTSTNMICPKCGQFQEKADVCISCGVVIAKIKSEQPDTQESSPTPEHEPDQVSDHGTRQKPIKLSFPVKVAIAVSAILVCTGIYLIMAPKQMTIEEFIAAKKASVNFRDFRIEGKVEPFKSVIETHSSDGKTLSTLKISRGETTGYVTYDPDRISELPAKGDYVSVTGRFQKVPFYDFSGKYKTTTVALVTSLTIREKVAPEDED